MNILKTITQYLGALFILLLLQLDNQILGQCSLTDICNGAGSYSCCYGDSENLICTYCPDNPGDAVSLTTFGGELYSGGDYFRVYEGTGTGGTLLAEFQGTSTIDALLTYTSTDPSGCLTVQIFSDFVISCGASGTGQQNPIEYEINYICTPPVPDVAFSPQPACSQDALNYQEITFNGEGSFSALGLEINDYVWDFGDGQSETGAIVTHGYDLPGGYIGSLTITDASGCEETTDFFVEVSGAPFEWFTLGVEEVCPLDAIQLTSLVNVPYSWSETFESELIEGPFYPDFPGAPDDDGNFSVTIPIEAPEGIVVTNPNEISITIDMATSFAGDLQIILSCPNGSQANILQYPNSLGGTDMGNPVAGVPLAGSGLPYTITPNASQTLNIAGAGVPVNASIPAGDYLPEQSFNAFNGCPIDGNWTLTVIDNLGIDFVLVYDVQLSFGEAADSPLSESFICESNNDDIYWIDQDGSIVNDGVFTAPGTPGTYTYTSVIPNECGCEYTQEFDVVVSDPAVNILCANCPPSGSIDLSASSDGPYCEGDVYQLNASSTEDPALVEYSWSGEGGFTSDLPNPIAPTAGLYEVLITVDGCPSVPESVLVEVNTSPKGSDFQIICVGDSYELPDGTIVTPTDDMVFSDIPTGFTADNGCDSLVNVSIVVNAIPEVALSDIALCQDNNFIDLSLITVLPLGGDWYSGDNSTTGTLISESDYFQDGLVDQQQFYYELVDAAGCAGGAVMTAYVGENPAIDFQDVACLSTTEFTFNLFVGQLGGTYDVQIEPDADGFPLNDINGGVAIPINLPLGQTYELFAELTVGAGCESDAIEVVAPNCGCPIVEDAPDLVVDFCMEGLADTIGFLDNVTVTNLDNLGGFAWFTDDTYTTEAIDFELSHNGIGSNCDAETATFYAAFSCLNNTIPIPAGSITINVYPDVSQAEINLENDGTCGPSVVDYDCAENPNYTLTNDYDENGATPDFTNELSTNTFTFTLENVLAPVECADLEVEASYFCVNCPQIDPDDSASNICDGSAFDYESLAASLSIENPNGNNIQFFINNDDPENPQEEYTGELLSGLTDVICEPAEIVLHAFILCDEDADTGTPDIWVDLSYTHTLTIYPSELPEITVEGDCQVNPIITVPECETYLNITPELFEYNPGENGNDEFSVTFDYPTNIDGDCIESTAVPFDYNCPAACPSIVNNPLNEQFDLCDNGNAIVNLLDEQESISTDLDANAEFVWFDTNGDQVTGDLTAIPINHSGNNCNPETFTFTLEVACQGDANFDNLDGGTYTIVLYPSVDAAWFEVPNSESCTAVIVDSCPDNPDNPGLDIQYSLDGGNNFSDTSPTDLNPGESQTITYQISVAGAPNNCSIENTYEINCPLADCPASNFGNPATENICANGIPNLPQLGIDYDISDLGGTQLGGVTWYFDSDFNNPYNEGDPIPFNGNDACAAGPPTSLTAWVECDNNNDNVPDQNIPVAEHIVVVFPEPGGVTLNGPSVSAVDGVCTFTIVATCPDDVLSLPTFTTTPGEEGGTQTVTVTSSIPDNPCVEISVDLDYSACPSADCFISDFQDVVTESLCSGDTPTLPELGTDFNLEGNANTQDGDVVWFSGTDPDVDPEYTPEPVSITGCEASDVTTVSAFVQCNDGTGTSWVPVASHNFQVYPLVETPTVIGPDIQADGTCGFSIAPACPNDLVDPANIESTTPGSAGGDIEITVTTGIAGSTCSSETFTLSYSDCPSADCFISDFDVAATELLCQGEFPTLPQLGLDFNLDGNANTQEGDVEWFSGDDPDTDGLYTPETVVVTGCDPSPLQTVYAFLLCNDGTGTSWIPVASHSFQFYPEVEIPTVDGPSIDADGFCMFTVVPDCPDYVSNTESISIGPGQEGGTAVVTVDNPNDSCAPITFDLPYGACPSVDCFSSNFTDPVTDILCAGDLPVLPNIDLDAILGGNLVTVVDGSLIWHEGVNPDTDPIYTPTTLSPTGCDPVLTTVYAFVGCLGPDDGISLIQVASHNFEFYPELESPTVEGPTTAADGSCTYTFVPACPDDVLSSEEITITAGSVGGAEIITVENPNNLCLSNAFTVNYDGCPSVDCFTSNFTDAATDILCAGDLPILPNIDLDAILGGNTTTVLGGIFWYEGTNPDADPEYTPSSLSPTGCDPETVTIYAYVQCSSGGNLSWVQVASHNFEFYPALEAPTLEVPTTAADGACNYVVTAACPNDVLDMNDFSLLPGADAGTQIISVSNPNNPCVASTFNVSYDACPSVDCFTANIPAPITDVLCAGELPVLPTLDLDSILDGNVTTAVNGSLFWSEGSDPVTDTEYIPSGLLPTGCDSETTTINAYVQCSSGGDLSWVQVASHSFEFYPELQSPTIATPTTAVDGTCNYVVTAACPDDVLNIPNFNLPPGTEANTQTISVSNPNNPCVDLSFDLAFDACLAVDCFTSSFDVATTEVLCSGSLLTLPQLDIDFALEGNTFTVVDGPVTWYTGPDPNLDAPFDLSLPVTQTGCEVGPLNTIYAFVQCNSAGALSWVEVASHNYQVYPLVQQPLIDGPNIAADGTCTFQITPACTNDAIAEGLTITTTPGSAGGTQTLTVTSGLVDNPCPAQVFNVDYSACPSVDCFMTNFPGPATELLCSGDTPTLPILDLTTLLVGNPTTIVDGSLAWYSGVNPDTDTLYTAEPVFQTDCGTSQLMTVYAFVECSSGGLTSWVSVASHNYQVYPIPQTPILNPPTIGADGACNFTISPICPEDVLDTTNFSVPAGEPGGDQTVNVTNGGVCIGMAFDLSYGACDDNCPTMLTNAPVSGSTNICSGNTVDLLAIQNTITTDQDNNTTFTWTDNNGTVITPPLDFVTVPHSGACQADTVVYSLEIDCTTDTELNIVGGTYEVIVYPQINNTVFATPTADCEVIITDNCLENDLTILYADNAAGPFDLTPPTPPITGTSLEVFYQINLPNAPVECAATGSFVSNCPSLACPTTDFDFANPPVEALCDGGLAISLPEAGTDFTINDDAGTLFGAVVWLLNNDPENPMPFIDTEPFNHSGLSLCIPDVAVTLYAFVECDSDLDTVGDTWIPVAQHQVVVYPEIQIPTLVGPDVDDTGDCTYTILPACPGDVLDVDATFTLPPSSTSDTITVGVTSGLIVNPCNAPVTFDLAYTDCPNANCVGTDFDAASAITEFLCSGEVVTLPTFNLTGNLSTAVGNPMWYEGDPEDGNVFVEDPQFHSGVDNCLPDAPVNINAYVECDTDGDDIGDEWIPLASHTFQVFPEIQAPTLSAVSIDADGNCTYTIETNCDTDVLSIVETITLAPGEAAGTADGTITSDVPNNPCPSVDFSLPYDTCSDVDCPNLVTTAPIDALCNNGGTIDLADLQDAGIVDGTWTVVNNLGDDIPLTGFAGTVFDALGLDPGDYTATYTPTDIPPASCPPNTSETITVVGNPTITADNDGPVCAGGDIQLNVTSINGASYEWTGPDSFASLEQNPLLTSVATVDAGEYSVTVTLGACTSTASTVVVVNEQPNISISPENSAVCPGSPVTLTVNGFVPGTILDWGGDDVVFDNPDGSVVTVTPSEETNVYTCVATAGDCESTATATVSVTDQLEVLVTPSAEGFCESTEYYLVLSGATEYDLLNFNGDWEAITADSILINSTDGNTFQIIGNDGGDCESPPTDFTIPVSDEISITMDSELPFGECTVGEVLATATGGTGNLTYSWTPALGLADPADSTILQPNISVDEPTVFTLTVEDDLGCTASASLEAIPSDSFDVIVTTGEDLVLCPGASQTITLSGAETYEWVDTDAHNGETATIIGDIDEPYQEYPIIGYDQYNCTDTLILTVTVSNDLEVEEIPDTSVCLGSSIQLSIPNADTEWIYEWVGPELDDTAAFNPMVSPIEATLYEVTVTDEDGCTNTAEVNVSVNDIPVISPGFNDNNVCFDVPVGLGGAADNAESYLWTGGSGTFVDATSASTSYLPGPNDAGETNLTFTATNVCGSNQNVIAVNILPQQSFAISDDYFEFCEGEPIDLSIQTSTVENYVDYTASEGSFAPTNNEWTLSGGAVTPGTLQDYYLSVETICGNLEDTLTVLVNPTVEVIAPTDTTINIGSSVFLEAEGDTSENYIWTVAESVAEFADLSLSCENCESPEVNPEGTTTYMVTSGEDCATSSTVTINVLTETIALIPNAFSPNGDGRNDLFRIFGSNFELDDVYIFNRYGHLIYEAKDNQGWDGYYEGEAQEIGVYLYMVRYHSTIDGTVENFTGNVTLIR